MCVLEEGGGKGKHICRYHPVVCGSSFLVLQQGKDGKDGQDSVNRRDGHDGLPGRRETRVFMQGLQGPTGPQGKRMLQRNTSEHAIHLGANHPHS